MKIAEHTPGPWRWEISLCSKRLHLVGGETRFDLTVMDFVRWGMSGASMRLREDIDGRNLLYRCEKWAKPVAGREHHSEWFQQIDHPDARLIESAPDLLAALENIMASVEAVAPGIKWTAEYEDARAAVKKARGI
jgi:hypothetical protein